MSIHEIRENAPSVGFSFDTTRGPDVPTFTASKQQLSAVSFRYEFLNHRNPLRRQYNDEWNAVFVSQIGTLTSQLDYVALLLKDPAGPTTRVQNPGIEKWVVDTRQS
jgi:hypothetical protein